MVDLDCCSTRECRQIACHQATCLNLGDARTASAPSSVAHDRSRQPTCLHQSPTAVQRELLLQQAAAAVRLHSESRWLLQGVPGDCEELRALQHHLNLVAAAALQARRRAAAGRGQNPVGNSAHDRGGGGSIQWA